MKGKLSYANVMATIAVFLVVAGGVAYAGSRMLPKGSVGPKQLRKNSVNSAKVRNHSLRGVDIRINSLGTVPAARKANQAAAADRAGTADLAARANGAANADALGGLGPSGYVRAGELVRFATAMAIGDPPKTLGSLGPLTFIGSCGEQSLQTHAVITVKTSAGPIFVNGFELSPAGSRELAVTTSNNTDEYTAELVTVASEVEAFAADGAFTSLVNTTTGVDCRFVGHLLTDSG